MSQGSHQATKMKFPAGCIMTDGRTERKYRAATLQSSRIQRHVKLSNKYLQTIDTCDSSDARWYAFYFSL